MKKSKLPIFLLIEVIQNLKIRHKYGWHVFSTSYESEGWPKDYLELIKI